MLRHVQVREDVGDGIVGGANRGIEEKGYVQRFPLLEFPAAPLLVLYDGVDNGNLG